MIIINMSLGVLGLGVLFLIGYILVKAVIGIVKGIYHGFMKLIGKE